MLINSEEEQKSSGLPRHQKCSYCHEVLYQPRIILRDAGNTSYHPQCAAHLMTDLAFDMHEFFASPHIVEMANSIHAQAISQAMSQAFRDAAHPPSTNEQFWGEG